MYVSPQGLLVAGDDPQLNPNDKGLIAAVLPHAAGVQIVAKGKHQRWGFATGPIDIKTTAGAGMQVPGIGSNYLTNDTVRLYSTANATDTVWERPVKQVSVLVVFIKYGNASGATPLFENGSPNTAPYEAWGMVDASGVLQFGYSAGGTFRFLQAEAGSVGLGQVIVALGTYNGATARIYKNGVLKNSGSQTGDLTYPNSADRGPGLASFWNYPFNNRALNGRIFLAALWDVGLSEGYATEITKSPQAAFDAVLGQSRLWLPMPAAAGGGGSFQAAWARTRAQVIGAGAYSMYPRNAASPERVSIGAVVQISDGAVQTSGVSIKVKPQGTTASAGGGTTSYEEGIVEYLPTQAETNYTSFEVIAYKTGCIPVSVTVVTTASATPGYAGVDWSKVTAPTTTLNLSGTTIKTATDVETDTADIQSRIPAALVSGRMDSSVGAMAANVMTAAAAASDLTTELQTGLATAANLAIVAGYLDTEIAAIKAVTDALPNSGALTTIQADLDDIQTRLPAALVSGRMDASVGAMASGVLTATAIAADAIGASELAADAIAEIADAVWDEVLSGHAGVGSTGAALSAAGGSGDPWATALPGAYGAGTAGQIVGDYIDAAISGVSGLDAAGVRAAVGLASANLDTQLSTIDTVADAILVDTAEIGAAGAGLTALASAANLATVAGYLDTEIAAIKDKTDSLTFTVAGVVDANIQRINDVTITGNGGTGTEFGV